jgi:CPA1 family monovalent cation:H+ antiporter
VIATVACGLYISWNGPLLISAATRLQGIFFWDLVIYLIEGLLFLLTGFQMRALYEKSKAFPLDDIMIATAVVLVVVVGARFAWLYPATYLPRMFSKSLRARDPSPPWQWPFVLAFTGVRGAVSLAAALALPLQTESGAPLPGRELIQFITFALILVTVVGQGLTLPWLIRRLGVIEDGTEEEREELRARLVIARAALDRVDELETEDWTRDGTVERLRRLYEFRQRRFKIRAGKLEDEDGLEEGSLLYQRMMHEIYIAQRQALVGLRNTRQISSEVMRRVEHELDLEESRLEV